MKPFLKWAGGKRQLLDVLLQYTNNIGTGKYFEPFLGGGSLFFALQKDRSVINDFNPEIVNAYQVIKDYPEELIEELKIHALNNSSEYFYQIRGLDRNSNFESYSAIQKAARTIYLNRTCYNGLYRVNSSGYFNVPFGRYKNPLICDENNIREISEFFNKKNILIRNSDFEEAVSDAQAGDYIYFDPPYDYEDGKGFVGYVKEGFNHNDLLRLKKVCDELIARDCKVLISNNDTEFVRNTFTGDNFEIIYETIPLQTKRSINSNAKKRNNGREVLIYGRRR